MAEDEFFVLQEDGVPGMLLSQLHQYARDRLVAGVGMDLLRSTSCDHPQFLAIYNVGFLPDNYRDILTDEQQSELPDIPGSFRSA